MATEKNIIFIDDIDGSTDGVEHYTFSWLGTDYEIDLAPNSAKKLVDVMDAYIDKATRVSKPRSGTGGRGRGAATGRSTKEDLQTVRSWAREQGLEVSDRGRVSEAVKETYDQAH